MVKQKFIFHGAMFLKLLSVLMLTACASTPHKPKTLIRGDYTDVIEYGRDLVRHEMKKHDVVGLSVALVNDQEIVWAEGFGFAHKEKMINATPDTVYRAGSISKLFTATAAMQLADQGRLNIDQPLKTYVPEFTIKRRFQGSTAVTPRALMTHHSGLPSDYVKGMWNPSPESFTHVVDHLRDEYAAYPPRYVFRYSNVGITLLGHAVQNASGRPFSEHMGTFLLKPLGMVNSEFTAGMTPGENVSMGYREAKTEEIIPLRDIPAGGLNASVHDLSRFMQMVFAEGRVGNRQLLSAESLAEMLRPQNEDVRLDLDMKVGLAWMLSGLGDIDIKDAGTVAHHGGATLLFHSQLIVLPEHKLGIVVLANTAGAASAVNKVATEVLKVALETKTGITQPDPEALRRAATSTPPIAPEALVGRYATIAGLASVTRQGDRLRAKAFGKTLHLIPRDDGRLRLQYRLLGLIPISLDQLDEVGLSLKTMSGRTILTVAVDERELYAGEKIPNAFIPDAWRARTGAYWITNLDKDAQIIKDVQLVIDDDLLILEYSTIFSDEYTSRLPLIARSDSEAIIFGLGRGEGETLQVVKTNEGEVLRYSGYLFERQPNNE